MPRREKLKSTNTFQSKDKLFTTPKLLLKLNLLKVKSSEDLEPLDTPPDTLLVTLLEDTPPDTPPDKPPTLLQLNQPPQPTPLESQLPTLLATPLESQPPTLPDIPPVSQPLPMSLEVQVSELERPSLTPPPQLEPHTPLGTPQDTPMEDMLLEDPELELVKP